MTTEFYTGETSRIGARDLTHAVDGAVTAGATVLTEIVDAAGTVMTSASITAPSSGDDWLITLTMPATAGIYVMRVTATKGSDVWKSRRVITVNAF